MIAAWEIAEALDAAAAAVRPAARPERAPCGPKEPKDLWEEAFLARTIAVEGGHVEWTGQLNGYGTPLLKVGERAETVYRYVFRARHGREAEGKTGPVCRYPRCVAGAHLEDRVLRADRLRREEQQRRQRRGVLTPPACATWHRDVDLVAVERVASGSWPLPVLTEKEQRYAVVVMTRAGLGESVIAERLGVAERTVDRWRDEAGLRHEPA
ncbi:helix-turn-helix domain-containing protein [Streptomyces sp. NPDC057250]|uniref:helix-turn-helix domain-containing protein n=1 Tax=Streptomyces sp. NPDC057250 TaxID=3346068 RepID=UPI00363612B3